MRIDVAPQADKGLRKPESKRRGLERAAKDGAEIVTTEMALFGWLADASRPQFRAVSALVK